MNVMYSDADEKSVSTTSMVSDIEERSPSGSTAVTVQKGARERVEEHAASTMPSDPANPASQLQKAEAFSLLEYNEQVWQAAAPTSAL
jgi:hypothetical protein